MTSEVAIMNKEAIALAADSAVTLTGGHGKEKIFTSANKIFALSKYYPVAVMLYGNASFMDIPWETLIKIYRRRLGTTKFDTLQDYANDFLGFLNNSMEFFPESQQDHYFRITVYDYFTLIKQHIKQQIRTLFAEQDQIGDERIEEVISDVIQQHYDRWTTPNVLPSMNEIAADELITFYRETINIAKQNIFQNLPISESASDQLTQIAALLFLKASIWDSAGSGIVIAGFGENELFPSLRSFWIEGVINNHVKYIEDHSRSAQIGHEESTAGIIRFAQSEMVGTFLGGIDPNFMERIENDLSMIFMGIPEIIVDDIREIRDLLNENDKRGIKERLSETLDDVLEWYIRRVRQYSQENYTDPVLDIVQMLPKDELARMAEALVNLTKFKRRVTWEEETVGGPIDVAVISKGDGFIWIKRKQYFEAGLNPQFFEKYHRKVEQDDRQE